MSLDSYTARTCTKAFKYENQIIEAITSCFYDVNPVWFTTQELCNHVLIKVGILLSSEPKIKLLLIENGYPTDVLLSCINQKLANFAAEKAFGPEKCPAYL